MISPYLEGDPLGVLTSASGSDVVSLQSGIADPSIPSSTVLILCGHTGGKLLPLGFHCHQQLPHLGGGVDMRG